MCKYFVTYLGILRICIHFDMSLYMMDQNMFRQYVAVQYLDQFDFKRDDFLCTAAYLFGFQKIPQKSIGESQANHRI